MTTPDPDGNMIPEGDMDHKRAEYVRGAVLKLAAMEDSLEACASLNTQYAELLQAYLEQDLPAEEIVRGFTRFLTSMGRETVRVLGVRQAFADEE